MYSPHVVRQAFALRAAGLSQAAIARQLAVARATVRDWFRLGPNLATAREARHAACAARCVPALAIDEAAFAYLLGQYLGDGCISEVGHSFRLRLSCCDLYPGVMDECEGAIRAVHTGGRVGRIQRIGCTEIYNQWFHWPCLLPHGDGGLKHERAVELTPWQRDIALGRYPDLFVRGLIHSDGWRGINNVRGANGRPYAYSRYQFSNRSEEIRQLFVDACDALGVETRPMNRWNISVNTRASVALLDRYVGPKY